MFWMNTKICFENCILNFKIFELTEPEYYSLQKFNYETQKGLLD